MGNSDHGTSCTLISLDWLFRKPNRTLCEVLRPQVRSGLDQFFNSLVQIENCRTPSATPWYKSETRKKESLLQIKLDLYQVVALI